MVLELYKLHGLFRWHEKDDFDFVWIVDVSYLSTRPTRHPPPRLIFQQVPTFKTFDEKTTTVKTTITANITNTTKGISKATYHDTIAMVAEKAQSTLSVKKPDGDQKKN